MDNAHATIDFAEASRYEMWLINWSGDYPDANAWSADALHCLYGVLRTGRPCDANDTLLDQAGLSGDISARFNAYTQAETGFFGPDGSFPVIPLVITASYQVQQPWLSGIAGYGPFQFDRWVVESRE
jgi:ABC-type oligopeptide transport system substrate-binding subunit